MKEARYKNVYSRLSFARKEGKMCVCMRVAKRNTIRIKQKLIRPIMKQNGFC